MNPGERLGALTVVALIDATERKGARLVLRCDCGEVFTAERSSVENRRKCMMCRKCANIARGRRQRSAGIAGICRICTGPAHRGGELCPLRQKSKVCNLCAGLEHRVVGRACRECGIARAERAPDVDTRGDGRGQQWWT